MIGNNNHGRNSSGAVILPSREELEKVGLFSRMRENRKRIRTVLGDKDVMYVSFRIDDRALDGVSLEIDEWTKALHGMCKSISFFSGDTKNPGFLDDKDMIEHPICHFTRPEIRGITDEWFERDDITGAEVEVLTGFRSISDGAFTRLKRIGSYLGAGSPTEDGVRKLIGDDETGSEVRNLMRDTTVGVEQEDFMLGVKRATELVKLLGIKNQIKEYLLKAAREKKTDVMIVDNVLCYPGNIPFSLAVVEAANQLNRDGGMMVVNHSHDFWWEQERFNAKGPNMETLMEYLATGVENQSVAVINTPAKEELERRTGVKAVVMPNVRDFDNVEETSRDTVRGFRQLVLESEDDIMLLLPVRPVRRKNLRLSVELADELQKRLEERGDKRKVRLVVTHPPDDEGDGYLRSVQEYGLRRGILVIDASRLVRKTKTGMDDGVEVSDILTSNGKSGRIGPEAVRVMRDGITLDEAYDACDMVVYSTSREGYGNVIPEAVRKRKPLASSDYRIAKTDILPNGFDFIIIQGDGLKPSSEKMVDMICDPERRSENVEGNFSRGRLHMSYDTFYERFLSLVDSLQTAT
ncbi:MAG: hypothetical protein ABIH11_01085 [Candidatus Altiarchaeota archaeon]